MNKLAQEISARHKLAFSLGTRHLAAGLGGGIKGGLKGSVLGTLGGLGIRPSLRGLGADNAVSGLDEFISKLDINDLDEAGAMAAISAALGGTYKGLSGANSAVRNSIASDRLRKVYGN